MIISIIDDYRYKTPEFPVAVGDQYQSRSGAKMVVVSVFYEESGKISIVGAPEELMTEEWWKKVYNGDFQR